MQIKHKYKAVRSTEDLISFPSKLERLCYVKLKELKEQNRILFFLRQTRFDLPANAKHYVDFTVFTQDEVLFVEAKGRDLSAGRLKRLQTEALYNVKIHIVKSAGEIEKLLD